MNDTIQLANPFDQAPGAIPVSAVVDSPWLRGLAHYLSNPRRCAQYVRFADHLVQTFPGGAAIGLTSVGGDASLCDVVARLGIAFASRGGTATLLVDADLTHSTLTQRLGLAPNDGFVEALNCGKSYHENVTRLAFDDLAVIPVGQGVLTSFDGVESILESLIASVRCRHRFVVFDLGDGSETMARKASRVLDGVFLKVTLAATPKRDAAEMVRDLKRHGANLQGCVLTANEREPLCRPIS